MSTIRPPAGRQEGTRYLTVFLAFRIGFFVDCGTETTQKAFDIYFSWTAQWLRNKRFERRRRKLLSDLEPNLTISDDAQG